MGSVLVFEDHPIVAITLREALERAGHRVTLTGEYGEALRFLARELPDALVVDVTQTSACWLLDDVQANARLSSVPVVITVDQLDDRLVGRAELALRKPYRLDDLLLAVRCFAPLISSIDRRRRSVPVAVERRRSAA